MCLMVGDADNGRLIPSGTSDAEMMAPSHDYDEVPIEEMGELEVLGVRRSSGLFRQSLLMSCFSLRRFHTTNTQSRPMNRQRSQQRKQMKKWKL